MSCKANYNDMQRSVMKGAGSAIKKMLSQNGGNRRSKKGGMKSSTMIGVYLITLMAVAVMSQYGIIPSIDVAANAVMAAAGPQAAAMYSPTFMKHFIENIYIFFAYPHIDPANRPAFCSDTRGAVTTLNFWAEGFDKFDQTCAKGAEATGIFITGALLAMVATMALSAGLTLKALAADKIPPKPQTSEMSVQATSIDDSQRYLQAARSALDRDPTDINAIREVAQHTQQLMAAVHQSPAFAKMEEQLAQQIALSSDEGSDLEITELSDETAVVPSPVQGGMFSCLSVPPPNIMATPVNKALLLEAAEKRAAQSKRLMMITDAQEMERGGRKRRRKTRKHRRKPKRRYTKRR